MFPFFFGFHMWTDSIIWFDVISLYLCVADKLPDHGEPDRNFPIPHITFFLSSKSLLVFLNYKKSGENYKWHPDTYMPKLPSH